MSANPSFQVGDKVVYPNHGVGIIETISSRAIGETQQEFYLLKIEASNLRVMVPFTNAGAVGMRLVTLAADMQPILEYLQSGEAITSSPDWKWRFKENSDKMRNGSLAHVAEVLKSLLQLHQAKPLSFREKKMLDRAVVLLMNEMASANGLSPEESLERLQRTLLQAGLVLPALDKTEE